MQKTVFDRTCGVTKEPGLQSYPTERLPATAGLHCSCVSGHNLRSSRCSEAAVFPRRVYRMLEAQGWIWRQHAASRIQIPEEIRLVLHVVQLCGEETRRNLSFR
jgi:hypothetical protein